MKSSRAHFSLAAAVLGAALAGCTGNLNGKDAVAVADAGAGDTSTQTVVPPEPYTVTFDLQNGGSSSLYVYQGCLVDLTITDLADPTHAIGRGGGCGVCDCAAATCPVNTCGACFSGGTEVIAGGKMSYFWVGVDQMAGMRAGMSCVTTRVLPAGQYRIDVPVYASADDAVKHLNARVASQTFALPATDDVQVGLDLPLLRP